MSTKKCCVFCCAAADHHYSFSKCRPSQYTVKTNTKHTFSLFQLFLILDKNEQTSFQKLDRKTRLEKDYKIASKSTPNLMFFGWLGPEIATHGPKTLGFWDAIFGLVFGTPILPDLGSVLRRFCSPFLTLFSGPIFGRIFAHLCLKTEITEKVKTCVSYWFLQYIVKVGILKNCSGDLQQRNKKHNIFFVENWI